MKRSTLVSIAALSMFVAVGCAKPPQDEINSTQAEMDRAKQAQAETWAPNEIKAAEEGMSAANAEISAQNEKWMKNYDKAKELLAKAREDAAKAAEAAAANKEQARKDAEATIAAADTAVQAAEAALKVAPVTKDSKADLELFKNDVTTLKSTLDAARQSFGSEDFKKALESATSVKDQATSIATQLEEAKAKRAGARK
jgi:serine phosphatase RsbU (regulator of sigma subunit)